MDKYLLSYFTTYPTSFERQHTFYYTTELPVCLSFVETRSPSQANPTPLQPSSFRLDRPTKMLRRPITTLSITAEDVADFEDRRAERLAREKEARRMAAMGILRDPSKQRAGPHGTAQQPVRGAAAGWEYDSEEEEEDDHDPAGAEGDDAYADEEDVRAILSSDRPQRVIGGGGLYGHHQEDGRMEVDSSSAPPPMISPAAGRGSSAAAAAAATTHGAIPGSRLGGMAAQISTPMNRDNSPVATPPRLARAAPPPAGPAAPSSMAGDTPEVTAARARSARTREERIGVAAPERRRRQPPQ